ncbi:MAG: DUF3604 domain-containing protein [Chloroflexi bacterium]|nr:DUF3604 domain-containing protein [Chloroflexota bacterium]
MERSPKPSDYYGRATISPAEDVIAGSYGTWTLTYTAGFHGIDNMGGIIVAWRHASDWEAPQTLDPSAPNYLTVSTSGNGKVRARFDHRGHVRPWRQALIVQVYDGWVAPGETITITYGDTSGGSPGSRAQTFIEDTFEFHVLADCFGTGLPAALGESPTLRIVGGPVERLVALGPSDAVAGQPFAITVRAQDRWGNPSPSFRGRVTFYCDDPAARLPAPYAFTGADGGVHRFEGLTLSREGTFRLRIESEGLQAEGNPIVCRQTEPPLRLFWGDMHGQSEETLGTGTAAQYFQYGRDVGALDFAAECGNDFQITDEHYADLQQQVKRFHQPGRFVTFLAFEWSGLTPAGGDNNVYYLKDDQPLHRSSHWLVEDRSDEDTDRYPISKLFETLKGYGDALVLPHIGGRRANLDYYDPALIPVIEICSVHGRFEWFAREAIERGLKVGFIGNSDDHTGRTGAAYPATEELARRNGLVAVYAGELTRQGIWDALWKRHCYATSGERIVLRLASGGHIMGDEFSTSSPPAFDVEVIGTGPLEKVEIVRGTQTVHSHPILDYRRTIPGRLRIAWSGARVKGRVRHTDWDGGLTVSNGRLVAARAFAMEHPKYGIIERTESSLRWHSHTYGDRDGVIVDLEGDPTIAIDAGPAHLSFHAADIRGPVAWDLGGVDQRLEVSPLPVDQGPSAVRFTWRDGSPVPGVQPYYVRVTQADDEMAWSSPLFVSYSP